MKRNHGAPKTKRGPCPNLMGMRRLETQEGRRGKRKKGSMEGGVCVMGVAPPCKWPALTSEKSGFSLPWQAAGHEGEWPAQFGSAHHCYAVPNRLPLRECCPQRGEKGLSQPWFCFSCWASYSFPKFPHKHAMTNLREQLREPLFKKALLTSTTF